MSSLSEQRMKGQANHGNNGDYNAWGGSSVNQGGNQYHSRSRQGQGGYDDYSNSSGYNNRGGYGGVNDGGRDGKHIERGMQGLGLGGGGRNPEQQQQKDSAPRKMTWASIASQPAKPTITQTSTILKKKGPGMPPPPMVPGRHNMDIMTWDSPAKNGPPLVPPTFNEPPQAPPPISTSPRNSESARYPQANGGGSGGSGPAWPTLQAGSMAAPPAVQQPPQQAPPPMQPERRPEPRSHNSYNSHQSHYERNEERGERSNQNHEGYSRGGHQMPPPSHQHHPSSYGSPPSSASAYSQPPSQPPVMSAEDQTEALNRLLDMSKYNPPNFEIENPHLARFFVIKSYSEDDIHRSIKYNIWCSTEHGNKRLDQAFHEREKEGGCVYLFYSVNASGHFCGMAQMISAVDYSSNSSVWAQDKWKGSFKVRWIFVKDVPNPQLRQIRLENNENKPITNSRDTQEVPNAKGIAVWRIISAFKHSTSLFDDFVHYELRQQEENTRRVEPAPQHQYRSGSPSQFDNKYQDRSNGGGHKYGGDRDGEQNNNPRGGGDMGSSSYDRNYRSGGYNNRNTYGNPNFERNSYQSGGNNGGGYNNRNYGGYRRDDQPRNQDGNDSGGGGPPSGSYHPRSGGNYRGSNNRGGFNNDYYNNRRPDNRDRGDRGDRGGYRPQSSSTDYTKE